MDDYARRIAFIERLADMVLDGEPCADAPGGIQTWDAEGAIDSVQRIIREARELVEVQD